MNATKTVTINLEQRRFVIPCGDGYTCLGFDVCRQRSDALRTWLINHGQSPRDHASVPVDSIDAYDHYQSLCDQASELCSSRKIRCDIELTPQLIGLEGRRVEVIDKYGETRRFQVGKSTGWMPIHLEIARRTSSGGPAVYGTPFQHVRVIR